MNKHGKICYLEIPARDIAASSAFYSQVFGWKTRTRGDGTLAFDDGVEVSGAWVTDRHPSGTPGILTYIMVDSVAKTIAKIVAEGGAIDQAATIIGPMTIARFRDPAGNILGLYQQD
jgi:predicted enzyme related to lactoylglutathione lyase